ncbi:MAG TPA: threonine/serine dehydratase [Actinomycetota bacterium]
MIGLEDVRAAADRLHGVAHRTPVLTSRTLDGRAGGSVFLKAENLQRGGAFKIRGAYNRMSALRPEELGAGVTAYSSGNHAQAVSLAAQELGSRAVILMPADAPAGKQAATEGYGAEIVTYDRYAEDRVVLGERLAAERGLTLIPPYDHPLIMAGQGTVALELLEEMPDLDALVVPVGGGGLIAGCGTAAKALRPGIRVIGVEPETADDTRRSLAAGERIRLPKVPRTIADGLQADVPGMLTFEVNRTVVDEVVTVRDRDIVDAMRFLFERLKAVVEPSGAVAVAALLTGAVRATGAGAVLSGGNIDARRFADLTGNAPDGPRVPSE